MTYAIIETGGKQLRVEPGRFYDVELLPIAAEETITIEKVLLVQHNGTVTIGQPLVAGATVEGQILRHLRDRKIIVYKMKPKKKTRKKQGHRQEITRLLINSISLNGVVLGDEETPAVVTTTLTETPTVETTPDPEVTVETTVIEETSTPVISPENTTETTVIEETPTSAISPEDPAE